MVILQVKKVSKDFGGLRALDGLDIDIHQGEIFGLIGPNGSGKTTWFNIITGFSEPTAGDLMYKGASIVGLKPYQIAQKRIIRTFQITSVFRNLSVFENVRIAGQARRGGSLKVFSLNHCEILPKNL